MNNQYQTHKKIIPNLPLLSYQLQPDSKLALKTRKDLEIHLITRALKDDNFKQELIEKPKALIEKELGSQLPDELNIHVLEETKDTIYMVLPCNPYEGISEEELEASLGMTYEDVALWVLELQRNALLDEESSIKLMKKVWEDASFKTELLLNPRKTIAREFSLNLLAPDVHVQVWEETQDSICLVLPHSDKPSSETKVLQVCRDVSNLMLIGNNLSCSANSFINACRN